MNDKTKTTENTEELTVTDQTQTETSTEQAPVEPENDAFNAEVEATKQAETPKTTGDKGENGKDTKKVYPPMSETIARNTLAGGLDWVTQGASMMFKMDLSLTPLERDKFAEGVAPYLSEQSHKHPWINKTIGRSVEVRALTAVCFLSLSLYNKYAEGRKRLELEARRIELEHQRQMKELEQAHGHQ
ncbi:hypothetical protein [Shewanella gelidii]|uniref:Uncharacterized protein n=1 Tax=Shewanella gelidii TaxID=1642821 RepID=A0A917JUF4_9GAMM|nr:hypothetical protein [Shewanella gelidii]MCL1098066.1 hypothetical protein [Shewanella gelidii]GGI85890.1 hypothetical protein GCM10009332_23990 [Shewanella gelidii]